MPLPQPPNYRQQKKQREQAKKKKNEEKRLRKGQVPTVDEAPPAVVQTRVDR
jgi:hypothetical protein